MNKSRLERFALVMGRYVPDAITACVVLMLVIVVAALALGNSPGAVVDAYYRGLWMLLSFTMQMTLIIVLSTVVGSTTLFRKAVVALSQIPKTTNQTVIIASLMCAVLSYFYWGLGIALGPIIAVYFAKEAERKGISIDFLFLLSVVWAANAVWQFGLSASAPLLVATPGHFLESTIGVVPLSTTIWSPAAIIDVVVFTAALLVAGCVMMPKNRRPISHFPDANKLTDLVEAEQQATELNLSERLERRTFFAVVLCVFFAVWLYYHFFVKKLSLDINSLNTILLFLCFLLHRSVFRFTKALQHAIASAWPVIVLYHLYAGVAGLIQYTNVGETMAGAVASISTPLTFPALTAAIGTVFAFFIPSSGGQWAIQGFVTTQAAVEVGVTVQRGLLAMSVGDHMGNLASPFWYVIIAGIARVDFRSFFGYGLLFAALWFVIGVVVFTFAPC
ncbi:MAG: short-chain fatty acid transporter [Acidobacteria bacterium]|nr:short-chain fatty acid transporter [Acidobacteriota bacterium]